MLLQINRLQEISNYEPQQTTMLYQPQAKLKKMQGRRYIPHPSFIKKFDADPQKTRVFAPFAL